MKYVRKDFKLNQLKSDIDEILSKFVMYYSLTYRVLWTENCPLVQSTRPFYSPYHMYPTFDNPMIYVPSSLPWNGISRLQRKL